MELTQLQYFLCTAKCGSITLAAKLLRVSQSTVSMAISRLESELGVKLFSRTGRSLTLTPAGSRFATAVTPHIAVLDDARSDATKGSELHPAAIHLSVEVPDLAAQLVGLYLAQAPDARVRMAFDEAEMAHTRLLCGFSDICLSLDPFVGAELASALLLRERVKVLLPAGHPLADRKSLHMRDLRDLPMISFPENFSYRRWTDGLCRMAGFLPRVCTEVSDPLALFRLVPEKQAVALVGDTATAQLMPREADSLCAVPLTDGFACRTLYASYHSNKPLTEAAQDFLSFLLRVRDAAVRLDRLPTAADMAETA